MKIKNIFQLVLSLLMLSLVWLSSSAYAQDDKPLKHFGQEVVLNGANIAWINFGFDVGTQNSTAEAMRTEFQELASYGGNSARWWLHASGWFSPDINNDGFVRGISPNTDFGVSDEDMINQVREILDAAWDEGILLTISLFSYDIACGENNNINGSVFRGSRFDGMLNVYYQSYIDNVLTPLVTELRDHPALFAWEIFNEADGMSVDGNFFNDNCPLGSYPQTNETLQRFVNLSTAKIHSIDPNVKVTTSVSQTAFLDQYTNDVLTSQEFSDPTGTLDFYQAHWYWNFAHPSNPYIISAQDRNLDRPIVLGEFGFGTEPETQTLSENLSQALLTQGYAGAWLWDMLSLSESEVETVVAGASSFSPSIDKAAIELCINSKAPPCYNSLIGEGPSTYPIIGSSENDRLLGGSQDDIINGFTGNDTLTGASGNDTIDGGEGFDTAAFSGAREEYDISETDGVITVVDTITDVGLDDGTDTLINVEFLEFTDGAFTVASLIADNEVDGTNGDDANVFGTIGADIIKGFDGDDFINASSGDDTLFGGSGDDGLRGALGADVLNGGEGNDTAVYSGSSIGITVNLATGEASGGHAEGDALISIENVFGSSGVDLLTGNDESNILTGASGDDIIIAGGGTSNTLIGQQGNDRLFSGSGADFLDGGTGLGDWADYFDSTAAVTAQINNAGSIDGGFATGDTFRGIENIAGSSFDDKISGNSLANELQGNAGDDVINASSNDDFINGGAGDDFLFGSRGADVIDGGSGNDTASYSNSDARVVVDLAAGTATGSGHGSGDTLTNIENIFGSRHNDDIFGDDNDNVLEGFNGVDELFGLGGDDTLIGGNGIDFLNGGTGNDVLSGRGGFDSFLFDTVDFGQDVITDFSNNNERIDFRGSGLSFEDLLINISNGNTVITLDGDTDGNSITLEGVTDVIDRADVIF